MGPLLCNHPVLALREQVAKLRTELRSVKKENEDLKQKSKVNTPSKTSKNQNNQEEWADSSLGRSQKTTPSWISCSCIECQADSEWPGVQFIYHEFIFHF